MEWIETTGKTVEEAVQRALQELGIDESELEHHVVQEPKSGFLGIGSAAAHVRARVRPLSREKPDRRNRRRRERGERGGGGRRRGGERGARDDRRQESRGGRQDRGGNQRGGDRKRKAAREDRPQRQAAEAAKKSEERTMSDVPMDQQAEMARVFTEGLVEQFGIVAQVTTTTDEDAVEISVDGDDVGVLIGPEGATMQAMREIIRTALQRQTEGQSARVRIDVGGYDARRREALAAWARDIARTAVETGRVQALEPMSPPDRKVVHDAAAEVEGVTTESEGDEPRRRVVIRPA